MVAVSTLQCITQRSVAVTCGKASCPATLCATRRLRIFWYYLPVFFWCQRQLKQHRAACGAQASPPPLVIGISAPQGSGKSTLVEQLEVLFRHAGSTAVGVSIDDFYLTFQVCDELQLGPYFGSCCLGQSRIY